MVGFEHVLKRQRSGLKVNYNVLKINGWSLSTVQLPFNILIQRRESAHCLDNLFGAAVIIYHHMCFINMKTLRGGSLRSRITGIWTQDILTETDSSSIQSSHLVNFLIIFKGKSLKLISWDHRHLISHVS